MIEQKNVHNNEMKKIVILLALVIISFNCYACDDNNSVICTHEWVVISVFIEDSLNNPYMLDYHYTEDAITKDTFNFRKYENIEDSIYKSRGEYVIFNDSDGLRTDRKGKKFIFRGFMSDSLIIKEEYVIAHNDCHVYKVSGKEKIVIK